MDLFRIGSTAPASRTSRSTPPRIPPRTPFIIALIIALLPLLFFQAGVRPSLAASQGASQELLDLIQAQDRDYEAAYARADAGYLADSFTEDAEITREDGELSTGRAAIQEAIQSALQENRAGKLAINTDSVRQLTPEVLAAKGSTTLSSKEGEKSSALFSAIYVKKNGKWKISQLVESPFPEPTPAEHLSELAWLVGQWVESPETAKEANLSIHFQNDWARGGNFLTRNITVKRNEQTTLEGWQIIGWDPLAGQIRSWTFDTAGGFGEATWTRDGPRWLLSESGQSPEGSRTSAEITLTKLSADRFTWEANNRTLDGEPLPPISRIEINRVKAPQQPH